MSRLPIFRSVVAGIPVLAIFATACLKDDPSGPPSDTTVPDTTPAANVPSASLSSLVPHGSVETAIQQLPPAADGSVTFVVRVVANNLGIGAYQGAVTFLPGSFQLLSLSTPAAHDDQFFLVNANDFLAGRIRFAGCTASAFAGTDAGDGIEAFRFTVRTTRTADQANLLSTLDIVGNDAGSAVSADRVIALRSVQSVQAGR